MTLTREHLYAVMTGTQSPRVEELRKILGYPVKQIDGGGSRFWYLHPEVSGEDTAHTCSVAVGFYTKLDDGSDCDIRQFLTATEQQKEIYRECVERVITEPPLMYLLLSQANQLCCKNSFK